MRKILWLFIAVILLSACDTESSDEVAVSAIWQGYAFYYDKAENKTWAMAEFRDGGPFGNDVILYAPSGITMNGNTMHYHAIPYDLFFHHYGLIEDGLLLEGAYVFTDKNSKTYANHADLTGMEIDFPSNLDTISKSEGIMISWNGGPVIAGETIEIEITVFNDTISLYSKSTSTVGDISITFSATDMASIPTGMQSFDITRSKTDNLQAATAKGGLIESTYHASNDYYIKD
ncbi:MAG: hypothetical protein KAT76_00155 [Bacteroidales bacterium]|nr:hypothetical protein [Bacteroidales bacterium]